MKSLFLSFILLLTTYNLQPTTIYASKEFHTSFLVNYLFDAQGQVKVEHQVTLVNLFSHVYPTSYTLSLRGVSPENITGTDATGPVKISTQSQPDDITLVTIEFNSPTAGKGEKLMFILHYTGKPAVRNGQIWEVTLPKLANSDIAAEYELHLFVPESFGHPAYISPSASASSAEPGGLVHYAFTDNQTISSGLVAAFGDFQTFDYRLTYHLQNSHSNSSVQSIALPPDTPYQRVYYDTLDPAPQNVVPDADGNWLANYTLKPKSTLQVVTSGQAHLLGQPTLQSHSLPTSNQLAKYLNPTFVWQSDSAPIRGISAKYSTPRDIYDFVVSSLSYDYNLIQSDTKRKGALAALSSPESSLCTEFTDSFIAISRAAGIPARELNGFAFTTDPHLKPLSLVRDILHSWPEYWDSDSRVWRSVDPTWGKTTGGVDYFDKLDLAHFVFAIHGSDPYQPLPAGLYKLSPASKDVEVKVGQYKDYSTRSLDPQWHRPIQFLPFLENTSQILIKNPNGVAIYNLPVNLESQNINLNRYAFEPIPIIPPFGQITLTISHPRVFLPSLGSKFLSLQVGSQTVTYNIPETKFYVWYALLTITVTAAVFAFAYFAHHSWHLHFQRRKV